FAVGAIVPLVVAWLAAPTVIILLVALTTLLALATLGGLGASAGGADIVKGALRVTLWGALAMAATAAVGMIFGVSV
uniref:VIT1/CCC1 transporter family protein n=1 Tax=uncultured Maricaulis sp. TaxID=174710 RepID=UPI0030DBB371